MVRTTGRHAASSPACDRTWGAEGSAILPRHSPCGLALCACALLGRLAALEFGGELAVSAMWHVAQNGWLQYSKLAVRSQSRLQQMRVSTLMSCFWVCVGEGEGGSLYRPRTVAARAARMTAGQTFSNGSCRPYRPPSCGSVSALGTGLRVKSGCCG